MLLDVLDHAGALDLEALGANRNSVHPAIGDARPYPGLQATLARLGALLDGSEVVARDLQDPLTFRTIAQQNGAARDAFGFVGSQLAIELNAAQSNPLVVVDEDRVISVGNFEMQPLATALDIARLALAPVISTAAERAVKLLQRNLTGLTEGLGARPALAESALSEYGIAIQAIAVEARLLAQPVSFELVSTTQAEGIEDRMTMAPLAARRLEEMVELGARVVSIELMLAAQACDLRGAKLGVGTARAARQRPALRPVPRGGRAAPGPRAARRGDPLAGGSAPDDGGDRRPPASLAAAVRARRSRSAPRPPYLDGDDAARVGGRVAVDLADHELDDAARPARPPRDRHRGRLAAADARARGARRRRSATRSSGSGRTGSSSSPPQPPGGSRRSRVGRPRDGFAGVVGRSRSRWTTWTSSRRRSTRCAARASSSSTRSPAIRPPAAPAWWPAVVDYTSQMQRAYFAWLAGGAGALARRHGRLRDPRRRRADPARAARLARRRRPLRRSTGTSSSTPRRTAGARSSCASRRSASSSSSSARDAPVVDPTPAIRAVDAFGESVARLIRQDNLIGLLQ